MKFLKLIALFMALTMMLAFGVACNSGGDGEETSGSSTDGSTEAPFIVTLTVIALDENGEEVAVIDEEEAQYNGLESTSELTLFDIISDYCYDNEIECTLDDVTGRLLSVGGYSIVEGGLLWDYKVNDKSLADYDVFIANGSEIVVTMKALGE